ncbi:MAG TPA: Ig-like domain repeat protein [Gemmatimonadales bacterium]|nr:Ig-like domain repeat protein [Gemmatimonadales bacterium]
MTRSARVLQVLSCILIAAGSVTCSGDKLVLPDEGDPAAITVVSGNNQNGTVGLVVTDSVVVRVTDSKARPVVDARVQFNLGTNGTGGDLIPDTAVTDADGRARARWVLGTRAGVQLATARVVGFSSVSTSFSATALADVADTVFALSGDGQTGTVGVALAESLVVRVNDQFGNPVSAISVGWSVSGGGTVSAATVATGANGQAAVQRVLGPNAGSQSAAATVPGVSGSPVGFTHNAVAGGPTALLKIDGDNQTAPAGTFLAESLDVQLVDGSGNGVAGRQIAFTPSPNNGSAAPTSVVTDVNGMASSRWTLGAAAGAQSLIASGVGFSVTFNAVATSDVPTQMAITAGNNQTATAGTAVPVDPTVRVRDVGGNNVPNVSVTFTVTGGGGTVTGPSGSGTSTIVSTDAGGLATLTSWTLGGTAGANTMSATASGPSGPLTGSPLLFTATGTAGPPDHLTITTQPPATVASGSVFGTAPVIQVRDAGGNPVNQANINVTVSLASGSGTLNGTKTQPTNSSGQATFSGLSISGLVGPYTLDFNSGSLTGATSATINLTAGAATKLILTVQPSSSAQNGVAFAQQPVLQIQDAAGNPVSQSGVSVTASIATGGGTLGGINPVTTNSSGVATFTNLAITGAAGGRTLDFNATGLTKATSTVVTIGAGGATKLGFGVQPTNTQAGSAISPAVTVLIQDASGNTVSGATNAVSLALGNNPSSGVLSGTLTVNAVNGVATFSDLSVDKVGSAYTLAATASGLSGAASNGFNITPGTATQLVFTQQPSNGVAGASITPAVTVTAKDAQNNTVTSYSTAIGLALGNNPGSGTLTGGAPVTPVSGVATFSGLSINRTGAGYTLVASSGTLNQISTAFNVSPGAANQLVFVQQPSNSVAGSSIAPPVQVAVEDALGNILTTATTSITLAIGNNPPGNGVLTGGGPVSAVNGIATFSTLKIDKPGTGYTLTANGGGLPTRTSASFDISVGSGNKLAFIVDPSNSQVGQPISPAIQVQIQDAGGNPVGGTNPITLVIGNNPGSANLLGGGPVSAVNGIATFSNARLDAAGSGYTLTALSSGLLSANSGSFDISPAGTTTTITSDLPDPSRVGQAINVVFSVVAVAPGAGTPTGNVTVSDGSVSCQASVAAGTCQLFPTTAGAKTITASYPGDGNYTASTSAGTSHQVNPAGTTTLVTSDTPDPSVVGQPTTLNFVVTVNAPGDGTPTGNVTFTAGADSCVVPVSAGSCSLTFTSPGAKTITASYPGDGNFNPSQDTEAHTVNKAASTVTITSDLPDPSGSGEAVTVGFTVVASAPGAGTPTGNVVVTVSGSGDTCTGTVAAGSCSLVITTVGANKTITATYAGDANFLTGSDTELHDVNAGGTTTTITSTTPSASVVGQTVAIHYSVTPTSGGTPTGTVSVTDGTQSCNATVAAGQCSIAFSSAGARTLVATYSGDANFGGSTSAGFGQQVNTAATTTAITADSPDPSTQGQAYTVDYTVSVTAPGAGTPTGSVIVSDGLDTCSGTVAAGSCSLTSSTTGTKSLVATYQGDGDFTGSASPGVSHTVNSAGSTTTITSDNPDPSVIGQGITVNFSVTSGGGTPTGAVTVSDGTDSCNGNLSGGTGSCVLTPSTSGAKTLTANYPGDGTFPASSDNTGHQVNAFGPADPASSTGNVPNGTPGVATVITVQAKDQFGNNVTVGGENVVVTVSGSNTAGPITATDNGDGTYSASYTPANSGPDQVDITMNGTPISGSPFNTTVAVGPAFKMQMFAGDNQSAPVGSRLPVDPAVVVQDLGNNPVSGVVVSFIVGSGGGSVTAGSATTNSSGIADVGWILGATAGANTLTATSTGLQGSPVVFSATATPGATVTTITADTPDPSAIGQAVTVGFSVAVSAPGSGTPGGNVTVSDGVNSCVASVAAGTCNVALLTPGSRPLTASYAGDGNFTGSTSSPAAHTVNLLGTTTTITSHTPSPSLVGEPVDVNVTVSGGLTPTGSVTVSDGTDSCVATLVGGSGTCSVALSSAGTQTLVASYGGDALHAGSNSIGVSQTVNQAHTKLTITGDNPNPSVVGQPVAVDFTIVVTGNGGGTPTGNVVVTVNDGSGDTCTGTLAAGTCNLVLTTPGNKTITASYVGSADYLPDSDNVSKHDVDPFGPVDPGSSTAVVPAGQTGQQTSITIQARDQFGNAISSGGETVVVTISGANSDTAVVTDNGDGTYSATYTPSNTGTDSIVITINGTPIQGSPFSSTIS